MQAGRKTSNANRAPFSRAIPACRRGFGPPCHALHGIRLRSLAGSWRKLVVFAGAETAEAAAVISVQFFLFLVDGVVSTALASVLAFFVVWMGWCLRNLQEHLATWSADEPLSPFRGVPNLRLGRFRGEGIPGGPTPSTSMSLWTHLKGRGGRRRGGQLLFDSPSCLRGFSGATGKKVS